MLTISFTDQAEIAVGNQLRLANAKLDALAHEHRPITLIEQLLQDLGEPFELRRKF